MNSGKKSTSFLNGRLGSVREWHWISSAICLIGMLLFSITGITLNHASQIKAEPQVTSIEAEIPAALVQAITIPTEEKAPLPSELVDWLYDNKGIRTEGKNAEWSEDEIYLSLPRPGGDAWLTIDLASGALEYELTERGWVSYFNDLHKGRNTGVAWSWFLDFFAVACIIFCLTGLLLLQRYSSGRPATWPMVALGLVLPWVLILLFIH
jgi:uncharacterized protein